MVAGQGGDAGSGPALPDAPAAASDAPAATPGALAAAPGALAATASVPSEGSRELAAFVFAAAAALIYGLSNPQAATPYDQTFLFARVLLGGELGIDHPRSWLELVPGENLHYSVFPLGAVLTLVPAAALSFTGWFSVVPVAGLSAVIGGGMAFFSWRLAESVPATPGQRFLLATFPVFGTWSWANVLNGGAWQLALGFAVVGLLGALHFSRCRPSPVLCGAFFALAFGNRTELILAAPLFAWLLAERSAPPLLSPANLRRVAGFCLVPFVLGVATLAYNYARFHSIFDFGYERIPYLLDDPFYADGFFSWRGIEPNLRVMFLTPWASHGEFPWIRPNGAGESILLVSPALLLCLRARSRHPVHSLLALVYIIILTMVLWLHGNAGGYQFAYRYGMILIPFFFWILLESSPERPRVLDTSLYLLSFLANAWAVYAFYWGRLV